MINDRDLKAYKQTLNPITVEKQKLSPKNIRKLAIAYIARDKLFDKFMAAQDSDIPRLKELDKKLAREVLESIKV